MAMMMESSPPLVSTSSPLDSEDPLIPGEIADGNWTSLGAAAPLHRPAGLEGAGDALHHGGVGDLLSRRRRLALPPCARDLDHLDRDALDLEHARREAGRAPGFFAVGGEPAQLMSKAPSALIAIVQPSANVARWISRVDRPRRGAATRSSPAHHPQSLRPRPRPAAQATYLSRFSHCARPSR